LKLPSILMLTVSWTSVRKINQLERHKTSKLDQVVVFQT
jgi:hypothetical protein